MGLARPELELLLFPPLEPSRARYIIASEIPIPPRAIKVNS